MREKKGVKCREDGKRGMLVRRVFVRKEMFSRGVASTFKQRSRYFYGACVLLRRDLSM